MTSLVLVANAADGTFSTLHLHGTPDPHLEVLATSGDLGKAGAFAVDPVRDLVFAAHGGDGPGIATLRLDRATGRLTEVDRRAADDSLTYLTLTPDGGTLFGVSYGGGWGAAWPVEGTALGRPHSRFTHRNLHSIVTDDDLAYAASLGDDLIAQFRVGHDGHLGPLDPPTVPAPQGCGPRHLIVDGRNVYLVTEYSGQAIRYTRAGDGTLSQAESVDVVDPRDGLAHSRFGADPTEEHLIWCADVHRAGDLLLTSERSGSKLTSTAVGPDGRLGDVLAFTPTERQPRGFAVSPDGHHVIAVGERSTEAALLQVHADGTLTEVHRVGIGRGANWVRFVDATG